MFPSCSPTPGVNPYCETESWAHMQLLLSLGYISWLEQGDAKDKPSIHVAVSVDVSCHVEPTA